MAFFIGFAAVLIVAAFALGHRKVALGLAAAALVVGGSLLMYYKEEERLALTRISKSELVLENVTLKPNVSAYRIAGRITNNSAKYKLKEVDIAVTVRDCPVNTPAQECVSVGESNEILNLDVPPGETRDFAESVRFSGSKLKLKGRLDWSYSISRIWAE